MDCRASRGRSTGSVVQQPRGRSSSRGGVWPQQQAAGGRTVYERGTQCSWSLVRSLSSSEDDEALEAQEESMRPHRAREEESRPGDRDAGEGDHDQLRVTACERASVLCVSGVCEATRHQSIMHGIALDLSVYLSGRVRVCEVPVKCRRVAGAAVCTVQL